MGLEVVAQMIAGIGLAARATASDLRDAAAAATEYNAAASTSAGMTAGTGGSGVGVGLGSTSTTSLGDPRNGPDSAMRMNQAIEAAKRR